MGFVPAYPGNCRIYIRGADHPHWAWIYLIFEGDKNNEGYGDEGEYCEDELPVHCMGDYPTVKIFSSLWEGSATGLVQVSEQCPMVALTADGFGLLSDMSAGRLEIRALAQAFPFKKFQAALAAHLQTIPDMEL